MEIVYISGPMTGYPELNFPAFRAASEKLRGMGYKGINPAEIEQPITTWEACMREDIKQLMSADKVAVITGWEASKGAVIEVNLAVSLGMEILDAHTMNPVKG